MLYWCVHSPLVFVKTTSVHDCEHFSSGHWAKISSLALEEGKKKSIIATSIYNVSRITHFLHSYTPCQISVLLIKNKNSLDEHHLICCSLLSKTLILLVGLFLLTLNRSWENTLLYQLLKNLCFIFRSSFPLVFKAFLWQHPFQWKFLLTKPSAWQVANSVSPTVTMAYSVINKHNAEQRQAAWGMKLVESHPMMPQCCWCRVKWQSHQASLLHASSHSKRCQASPL